VISRATLGRVRRLLDVPPVALAGVFAAVIAVIGMAGALNVHSRTAPAFDLDAELALPAFVSGAVLLLAAAMALAASRWDPTPSGWPWLVLAGVFALMAADEVLAIHETLEDLTAVDWQTLYLPVMAVAATAWFAAVRRCRSLPVAAVLLGAGAAGWGIAGILESVEWTGPMGNERAVAGYGILMGIEELAELTGSACFALGPLVAAREWAGVAVPRLAVGRHRGVGA
jgi:hypothetical protein